MTSVNFADALARLSPPWLQRDRGGALMRGLGDILDTLRDLTAEAVGARFPRSWMPTALAPIGRDRVILRAPGETDTAYATRLKAAFTFWGLSGKRAGIEAAFVAAGFSGCFIVEDWQTGGAFGHWARFAIYIDGDEVFAAPPAWDAFDWDDGTRWDFVAADGPLVDYLVSSVKLLKPAHTRCIGIVVSRAGYDTVVIPVGSLPSGVSPPPLDPTGLVPGYLDTYLDFYLG